MSLTAYHLKGKFLYYFDSICKLFHSSRVFDFQHKAEFLHHRWDAEFLHHRRDAEFLHHRRDAEFLHHRRDAEFLHGLINIVNYFRHDFIESQDVAESLHYEKAEMQNFCIRESFKFDVGKRMQNF